MEHYKRIFASAAPPIDILSLASGTIRIRPVKTLFNRMLPEYVVETYDKNEVRRVDKIVELFNEEV
jgi:hypothetical protein